MKKLIFLLIMLSLLIGPIFGDDEDDPGLNIPETLAKQYIADKYDCDVNELRTKDVLVGRWGAVVDVVYNYKTERVLLDRGTEGWRVDSSGLPEETVETD